MDKKRFWNWAGSPGSRELLLCGTIALESWLDDDVTPEQFRAELMAGTGPITVWLNSYGGDCVAASRIYAMLIDYPFDVTVKIDGIAASAASVVAMAGSEVLMAPTACMMIHDPATMAMGSIADMEKAIEQLEAVKESILTAYEIKTGLGRETLSKMMTEETWMDARKAMELGFADGMLEKEKAPASDNDEPVLFARKQADAALVNKIRKRAGVPVKVLYGRLENLRAANP